MSRRHSPKPPPEPIAPVPPSQQQHAGHKYRNPRVIWDSREMADWFRQRDNALKRAFRRKNT